MFALDNTIHAVSVLFFCEGAGLRLLQVRLSLPSSSQRKIQSLHSTFDQTSRLESKHRKLLLTTFQKAREDVHTAYQEASTSDRSMWPILCGLLRFSRESIGTFAIPAMPVVG